LSVAEKVLSINRALGPDPMAPRAWLYATAANPAALTAEKPREMRQDTGHFTWDLSSIDCKAIHFPAKGRQDVKWNLKDFMGIGFHLLTTAFFLSV
jgi:hypothetical protein